MKKRGQLAGGVTGFLSSIPAGAIIIGSCSAVIVCVAGFIAGGSIVAGSTEMAYMYAGGSAAGDFDDAYQNTQSALLASDSDSFTVTSTTYSYINDNGEISQNYPNTEFTISGGGYSTTFSANSDSLFVNPRSIISEIFGVPAP